MSVAGSPTEKRVSALLRERYKSNEKEFPYSVIEARSRYKASSIQGALNGKHLDSTTWAAIASALGFDGNVIRHILDGDDTTTVIEDLKPVAVNAKPVEPEEALRRLDVLRERLDAQDERLDAQDERLDALERERSKPARPSAPRRRQS